MKLPALRLPTLGPTFLGLLAFLGILAASAPVLPPLAVSVIFQLLLFSAFAYSINFITGMTGYVSFGHVVFVGVGAYTLAYVVSAWSLDPIGGVALGALLGLALALGVGVVALRFRGVYFAISSLVTVLAVYEIILVVPQLNEGSGFFLNIPSQPLGLLYTVLGIVLVEVVVTWLVRRGRLGYAIRAVKDDEDAARSLGINAPRLKLTLFALSGIFAGAAGAVSAWQLNHAVPEETFSLTISLLMLAMIVVGGMGSHLGPLLGAVAVYLPYYYFVTTLGSAQFIVIGALVILIALFVPEGIVGGIRRYVPALRRYVE